MDRIGADFFGSVESIIDRLGGNPVVIQIPIGAESELRGVIDLVEMKAIVWHDEEGKEREVTDIPEEYQAQAEEWHHKMLDIVAPEDEALLEKYLDSAELDPLEIRKVIRKGTINRDFVPVLCGSAFKLSLIHISEPTRRTPISYAVFCLK